MSHLLIDRSEDLRALVEFGYEVAVQGGHLVLTHIPYVAPSKKVQFGKLVSALNHNAGTTLKPPDHTLFFSGETPCNATGQRLDAIINKSERKVLAEGLTVDHYLSARPENGYSNYFDKMHTYADMISRHAREIDANVTARTYVRVESEEGNSVFKYSDTASTRAGIHAVSEKLGKQKVGIIGLGGTGSYVFDFVAKTTVQEIHLFDDDTFLQHNAFRSPGAPSIDRLRQGNHKVEYFAEVYAQMRNNIVPHPVRLDESNLQLIEGLDFVFLCIDSADSKPAIVGKLEAERIPFIDVGMGVQLVDGKLCGVVRTTTSTPDKREHYRSRVNMAEIDGGEDVYAQNIQIAELNAFNAASAVIRWKKLSGLYADLENEHDSCYTIDGNCISNEDR